MGCCSELYSHAKVGVWTGHESLLNENESNKKLQRNQVHSLCKGSSISPLSHISLHFAGEVGLGLHITFSLTSHTKQIAAFIYCVLQFAHETCSWPFLVFLGPAYLLLLNSSSIVKQQMEKCNTSADSRIYENRRMKIKPVVMLNVHVQNKMLSSYQMQETLPCIDLVSLQNSSLKDHSKHHVLDQFI